MVHNYSAIFNCIVIISLYISLTKSQNTTGTQRRFVMKQRCSFLKRWNFSVGQHDVSFIPTLQDQHHLAEAVGTPSDADEDAYIQSCPTGIVLEGHSE